MACFPLISLSVLMYTILYHFLFDMFYYLARVFKLCPSIGVTGKTVFTRLNFEYRTIKGSIHLQPLTGTGDHGRHGDPPPENITSNVTLLRGKR